MAAVYSYPKPCLDPNCTVIDYQKAHAGFAHDADLWGPAVLDFLQRNGVK
jgi:hypothetical protein